MHIHTFIQLYIAVSIYLFQWNRLVGHYRQEDFVKPIHNTIMCEYMQEIELQSIEIMLLVFMRFSL